MTASLTPKGAATRQRIVEGAAAEIREHGVMVTLDDIRVRTGTSKSQLFHYFPDGREQLLLAVARYEAGRVLSDQQPQLGDLTSWAAWLAWRDTVLARYREQGQQCPLNALVSQLGRITPGAQAVVAELIAQWQAQIAAGVRSMQAAGEVAADLDAERMAAAMLAGIQGGVVMMMSTGDFTPLEAALDLGIEYLRASRLLYCAFPQRFPGAGSTWSGRRGPAAAGWAGSLSLTEECTCGSLTRSRDR
jgi:AcrR family transcriptional regulator